MGAFSNEGLFWINKKGDVLPVNVPPYQMYSSHEEYANEKWGVSLETALKKGYIRVQAISNQYLFIDHRQTELKNTQIPALEKFFYNNEKPIHYKQFVVERKNSDMKEFSADQIQEALVFAINGSTEGLHSKQSDTVTQAFNAATREKEVAMMHPYYQRLSSPIGDSFKPLGFKLWFKNN